jgi:hypothetical protein
MGSSQAYYLRRSAPYCWNETWQELPVENTFQSLAELRKEVQRKTDITFDQIRSQENQDAG